MSPIVIKFGGTSVQDATAMSRAIGIVAERSPLRPVVVVSALAGVTNALVEATDLAVRGEIDEAQKRIDLVRERHEGIGYELIGQKADFYASFLAHLRKHTGQLTDILRGVALVGDASARTRDKVVAIGEKLSSVLFSYTMRTKTLVGIHVDSENVIVTDEKFGDASPIMEATREAARTTLLPELERNHIPVMGGFFGRSQHGATTTLGRGGSDYSAAIVGASIDAEEIQIWTDVDGMMTTDPRLIPGARVIDLISYAEAAELASFGAKVLHPKTIAPAVQREIPIRVLNTHNPSARGTLITKEGNEGRGPRAIALKKGISVVHVTADQMLGAHGFLARIFEVFAAYQVSVDLVTTSEVSVSVTVDRQDRLDEVASALAGFSRVEIEKEMAVIALVGRDVIGNRAVAARAVGSLPDVPIAMLSIGSSRLNLSVVVPEADAPEALRRIHASVFELEGDASS